MAEDVASRCLGVAGLGDNLHVGLGLEDHADAVAHELMVVRQDDCDQVVGRLARLGIDAHTGTLVAELEGVGVLMCDTLA